MYPCAYVSKAVAELSHSVEALPSFDAISMPSEVVGGLEVTVCGLAGGAEEPWSITEQGNARFLKEKEDID